ncbi:MAG: cob(I)yrinic acid a,c-diamide adenosyltransferase [Omnitrophica bacterium RIFCSPLOWO2_12_FULL_44_17]|uniref:corrinoid adenosyltransferase n=1 Tax=Candidatus Danuiimicrobium aquiferis TaxID=1801832 RepID=A0A1G1KWA6_9BACT|nr:MAG: cob(I)yrinic acid a,c-diamide adenosyltransferase [Omnitrophica bacterium RIFCSPHIGHO2_02_FULL_45_28]OGW90285.1 MAG: cob(I)yrinic acid a,c-diamide adenosyltransferase [Omnitrophica bacterium RIFCSPHIGHO2_12_FULL_44_12]OGW97226.1 MAG: cob(I)yrinic acid a,c-diamide adenosyltransferase [Omnitrophica bacterium RIFCSPLOWO2_12_FULL_44_17]OGX02282.1 MAG: cob(I)yrinic acid a,c-diamide adenosyltransferase [Omnitrophica bacterium RIFCSPLOWO2_02_FULL_44_11]
MRKSSHPKKGLVIIYTGNGKGKTSAALGVALRAAGHGMKSVMIQFIKGPWKSGELRAAKCLKGLISIFPMGGGFTWAAKDRRENTRLAKQAWEFGLKKLMSKKYDIVIFDEINYAIDYGYLDEKEVLSRLKSKPPKVHVILTGRNAKSGLIQFSDLVTEMKEVKHPFKTQGLLAHAGIDF